MQCAFSQYAASRLETALYIDTSQPFSDHDVGYQHSWCSTRACALNDFHFFSLLVSYRPLASYERVDAQSAATQRIAINPTNHQCVCRWTTYARV